VAIYRKEHLDRVLDEINICYQDLHEILRGALPETNICREYNCEAEQFEKEYRQVSTSTLELRVKVLTATLSALKKRLKEIEAKKNHRG
jgi:hypothetical protein